MLKLSQAMIAILAQYKDPKGTIYIMKPPSTTDHTMEVVYKLETLVQSFSTFASTVMGCPGASSDQIVIAIPSYEKMHQPKIMVLN